MGDPRIKTAQEIAIMREGGRHLAAALAAAMDAVEPGVTTRRLDQIAEQVIRSFGDTPAFLGYHDYPATLCTSVNDEVVHGIPSDRVLRSGDIVGIDIGLIHQGLYVDMAKTVAVGKVLPEHRTLIAVTERALEAGIAAIRPGKRVGIIGSTVQKLVEKAKFGVVRDLVGHGIGEALHEDPAVPNFGTAEAGPQLEPGMTLAIEPMVTLGDWHVHEGDDGWTIRTEDGSFSAHFEHTVVVSETGAEILTLP